MNRTTTRTATTAVFAGLAIMLTGCGGASDTAQPRTPAAPQAASSPASTAPKTPASAAPAPAVSFAPDDPAVASFGKDRVTKALAIAQEVALAATANQDLLDPDKDTPDEIVAAVDTYLTTEARTMLAEAAQTIPTDQTQGENVAVQLVIASSSGEGLTPKAPYLSSWAASDWATSLDEDGRLGVDFTVTLDVLYTKADGTTVTYPVTRTTYYAMVPSPEQTDGPTWLIDDWASETKIGDPR